MARSRIVVGIDPGADGGIYRVEYDDKGGFIKGEMTSCDPDAEKTTGSVREAILLGSRPVDLVVVEKVHAFPGQGVSSMFTFGTRFGVLQGAIYSCDVPLVFVTSQMWQKDMGIKLEKGTGDDQPTPAKKKAFRRKLIKQRSFDMAKALLPVKSSGLDINIKNADAALIALWGIQFN